MTNIETQSKTKPVSIRKKVFATLLSDALLMAVLLASVELMLQVVAPEYRQQLYNDQYTGSNKIQLNESGYRGVEVPVVKKPGEFRILALGDSVTWGTGVATDQTWAAQLQKMIAPLHDGPVSVMNVAVPGTSVDELRESYTQLWQFYHPDMVIFVATANMVSQQLFYENGRNVKARDLMLKTQQQRSGIAQIKKTVRQWLSKACLPSFLSINSQRFLYGIGLMNHDVNPAMPLGPMLAYGWHQADVQPVQVDQAWQSFAKALSRLQVTLDQDQVPMLTCFASPRFATWDTIRDNEKWVNRQRMTLDAARKFSLVCNSLNLDSINLGDALRDARSMQTSKPAMFITFDYNHLDPIGHRVVAQTLKQKFQLPIAAKHLQNQFADQHAASLAQQSEMK